METTLEPKKEEKEAQMSVRLRVLKDGTRPDKRLCDTCRYSHILKGPQQGQEAVLCGLVPAGAVIRTMAQVLPYPVVECNAYSAKGAMTAWEAKQIGWVLETKNGKVIGFTAPKKRDPETSWTEE